MVKAVPHSNSVYSNEEIQKITHHVNGFSDRCMDDPDDPEFSVIGLIFPYTGTRELRVWQAERAMKYIEACVRKYPFNVRRDFAFPMWNRFVEAWDDTGDLSKAMRKI